MPTSSRDELAALRERRMKRTEIEQAIAWYESPEQVIDMRPDLDPADVRAVWLEMEAAVLEPACKPVSRPRRGVKAVMY